MGQHHHLGKLLAVQAQQLLGPAGNGLVAAAGQKLFPAVQNLVAGVGLPAFPFFGAPVLFIAELPAEPVGRASQLKGKMDQSRQVLGGAHAAHIGELPLAAGGLAVKGKADGVQQGGLSAAGGAGDEEDAGLAEGGEVDGGAVQIGAEGLEGECERVHGPGSFLNGDRESGESSGSSRGFLLGADDSCGFSLYACSRASSSTRRNSARSASSGSWPQVS